jgi:hypothetical protein
VILVLPFSVAFADAASDIEKALKGRGAAMIRGYFEASNTYEANKSNIHADFDAAIRVALAFGKFGAHPRVLRYAEIPGKCAEIAVACADAAEEDLLETDLEARQMIGSALMKAAEAFTGAGQGDKADKLQDRALAHLEAAVAGEKAPVQAYLDLGRLYGWIAERTPPKAEEYIQKAAQVYEKAREKTGDSAQLCLQVGETFVQLGEIRAEASRKKPKDRKLKKAVQGAYEDAMKSFEQGLKLNKKHQDLKTSYNEALWILKGVTGGKAKQKPIMREVRSRYKRVMLKIPDSELWHVTPTSELQDSDDCLNMYKYERGRGQALFIWIYQYKWDYNYVNEETGDSVGGDNIGGLAKRSERWVRSIFKDIKERRPLGKVFFSKRIPKARGFIVKGMTEKNNRLELRAIFFKHSKSQRTFRVGVQADLGMLEENPYELKEILASFQTKQK